MSRVASLLEQLGLVLPQPATPPPCFAFSSEWARARGNRVCVSGHSAQTADGVLAGPFGKVPSEVPLDAATEAARATVLSVLGSVKRAIGDPNRNSAWLTVTGMVNAEALHGCRGVRCSSGRTVFGAP
ncbi:RidA family protein [Compostimonas suwonensis]|uniref:Enamine deaminase RidA (YjgF/YER057c/UK114 family) n=1 Tax=Compostimonas suwonensis TaxID=1048394 RepID=A0A2M9C0D6_9MICO|nr:RidA family protein [Compostimonas suwonensis]PJJ63784.1 hypothetical protein CLV54_1459 [Compostimonas suwonensis]